MNSTALANCFLPQGFPLCISNDVNLLAIDLNVPKPNFNKVCHNLAHFLLFEFFNLALAFTVLFSYLLPSVI